MRDYLEQQIELRRQRLATLDQERMTLMGELRAYEDALSHSEGGRVQESSAAQARRSDESEGSEHRVQLSSAWRTLLSKLADFSHFTVDDVMLIAREMGKEQTAESIRSQLSLYTRKGIVTRLTVGKYRLTRSTKAALELHTADKTATSSDQSSVASKLGPELAALAQEAAGDARYQPDPSDGQDERR